MYLLKFRPDDRCIRQRGELVPVCFRGLEETVDTGLSDSIGIGTPLIFFVPHLEGIEKILKF